MAKMHRMSLFKVFLVLTLLTVATWAAPTPQEEESGPAPPPAFPIIVTSPGPGPWAIGSQQSVSWRTENDNVEAPYDPTTTVTIHVIEHTATGDELLSSKGPFTFGGGFAALDIDCDFVPDAEYSVQVVLDKPGKDGNPVTGNSGRFTVYRTQDASVCPAGPAEPAEEPAPEDDDGGSPVNETGPGPAPGGNGGGSPDEGPAPGGNGGGSPDEGPAPEGDDGSPVNETGPEGTPPEEGPAPEDDGGDEGPAPGGNGGGGSPDEGPAPGGNGSGSPSDEGPAPGDNGGSPTDGEPTSDDAPANGTEPSTGDGNGQSS